MQIHLTYRNTLRNVKRRVLHTQGLAMYYITRRVLVAGIPPHQQAKASPLHAVNIKYSWLRAECGVIAWWIPAIFPPLHTILRYQR